MSQDEKPEESDERRRRLVVFLLVFLLALLAIGAAAQFGVLSFGGTGELTVGVTNQSGAAASGQEVQIVDPDTGEVIASGVTDENGEAQFTLDQGDYTVIVGDSEQDVTLGEDTTVDLTVNLSPPEPD